MVKALVGFVLAVLSSTLQQLLADDPQGSLEFFLRISLSFSVLLSHWYTGSVHVQQPMKVSWWRMQTYSGLELFGISVHQKQP